MKRLQSNVPEVDTLYARVENFLGATGPDLKQMAFHDIRELINELKAHLLELESQNAALRRQPEDLAAALNSQTTFYDVAPMPYFTLDPQGNIVEVNFAAGRLLGASRDSLLGKPFRQFVTPAGQEDFGAHLHSVSASDAPQACELVLQPEQGPAFPAALESLAVTEARGAAVRYYLAVRDISRRRQTETDLRKRGALYRLIVETANEGIWAIGPDYRTTYVNPVIPELLGYRAEEMLGRPVSDFIFPEDLAHYGDRMTKLRQGLDGPEEVRLRRKDGSELWAIVSRRTLMDDQGGFQGAFAMLSDTTSRRYTEEALRLAAQQWQATFDAISDGICLLDLNYRVLGCNQAMVALVDQPIDTIVGCHCHEIMHATSQPIPECPLALMLQSRQREEAVLPYKERWFRMTVDPILGEDGAPLGAVHRVADITLLKQSREALKESEAHFRQLFDNSADAIFLHDQGHIVEVNEQACRSLGYSREELLRLKVTDIEVEVDWPEIQRILRQGASNVFIGKHRRKDGTTFPVEVRSNVFPAHGRPLRLASARDISAQREAERAIRESEKLYRSLFENMLNGFAYCKMIFEHDQPQDFVFLEVNRAFENLLGLQNVEGKKVSEAIPGLCESDPELLEIYGRVALTGKAEKFETYVNALNAWFSVSAYSPAQGYFVAIFDVITERKLAEKALRASRETLRVLLDATPAAVMLLDPEGKVLAGNKVLAQRLGKTIKQMVGTSIFAHLPEGQARLDQEHFEEIKRTGQPVSFEACRAGLYYQNHVHPIFSPDGGLTGFAVLSVDITARKQVEEALTQQSQFLQLLIDTIPTPVFYKDIRGRYLGCNRAYEDFHGLSMEQLSGETVACVLPPDMAEKLHHMDLTLLRHHGVQSYETSTLRWDGELRDVVVNKATFHQADGAVGGLIGVLSDVTEFKQAQQQLRALAARLAEVEELERQHLARELHDEVGQVLTALGLNLTLLKTQMPQETAGPLFSRLADAVGLVEKIGETIRNIMAELRPPVLDDYGLLSALRWYGAEFSQRTGIGVEVQGSEANPRLARPVELALFRIAQEALTNVAKHAGAAKVVLHEEVVKDSVRLIIIDNGVGFDEVRVGQPEGRYRWGLMNMSERAAAAGGSCHIESNPGHGTRVVVEVSR
jgi:PAS domain S-box-containing protein